MQRVDAEFDFDDGAGVMGPGTLLVHINSPLFPLAMWHLGRSFLREKYIIGCWFWELPGVPPEWRHGVPFVHEIWAPSAFTATAVSTVAGSKPVRVVPLPVAVRGAPNRSPRSARPFTVLTIFNAASSTARKNPEASVAAFRMAFGDDPDARLIVKASNLDAAPMGREKLMTAIGDMRNISLLEQTMNATEMEKLFAESDVLISLHRSEGFGLTVAEAMLRGLPAIATNWSSNVDFLSDETGIPVRYELVQSHDPQGTYNFPAMKWANPDIGDAALALRRLRDDPALAARLGAAGQEFARRNWTGAQYANAIVERVGCKA